METIATLTAQVRRQLNELVGPLEQSLGELQELRARLVSEREDVDRQIGNVQRTLRALRPEPPGQRQNGRKPQRPSSPGISEERQRVLIEAVREHGPISQARLGVILDWNSGKLSKALGWMREQEMVRVVGEESSENGGRSSKVYAIMEG